MRLAEQARQAEDRGDERTAELLLTAAVRRNPGDCETRLELSELLLQHGSMEAAVAQLRKLVAQNGDDPRVRVRLAQALYQMGQYAEASRWVDSALELDPTSLDGLVIRGKLHEVAQQDERALEEYHRVLVTDPDQREATLRIAGIHLRRHKPQQAAPLLRSVLDDPYACAEQKCTANWMLGAAYAQDERWAEAVACLEAGRTHRDMSPTDWNQLAYARYRQGNRDGARLAVNEVLKDHPQDRTALSIQAMLTVPMVAQAVSAPPPVSYRPRPTEPTSFTQPQ